jgi:hypothetical protein
LKLWKSGKRPSSDKTAKLAGFLWTPKINLQNLVCNFSPMRFE